MVIFDNPATVPAPAGGYSHVARVELGDRTLLQLSGQVAIDADRIVTQVPFVVTLWYSFQNYFFDVPAPAHFTGFSNYTQAFTNAAFRSALLRSVEMTVTAVIVSMVLGVAFALLLDRRFFGRSVVRTLIITPFLVMPAAAALVWAGPMLDPNFGLLNWLLEPPVPAGQLRVRRRRRRRGRCHHRHLDHHRGHVRAADVRPGLPVRGGRNLSEPWFAGEREDTA